MSKETNKQNPNTRPQEQVGREDEHELQRVTTWNSLRKRKKKKRGFDRILYSDDLKDNCREMT